MSGHQFLWAPETAGTPTFFYKRYLWSEATSGYAIFLFFARPHRYRDKRYWPGIREKENVTAASFFLFLCSRLLISVCENKRKKKRKKESGVRFAVDGIHTPLSLSHPYKFTGHKDINNWPVEFLGERETKTKVFPRDAANGCVQVHHHDTPQVPLLSCYVGRVCGHDGVGLGRSGH